VPGVKNRRDKTKKALTGTLAKTQYADKRLCLSWVKLQKNLFFVKPFFGFFEYFFPLAEAQKHEIFGQKSFKILPLTNPELAAVTIEMTG